MKLLAVKESPTFPAEKRTRTVLLYSILPCLTPSKVDNLGHLIIIYNEEPASFSILILKM